MKCEKMGISIAFLSAMAFFLGWYSLTMGLIIMLFVVCFSDNEILRKNVMTAFMFNILFMIASLVLGYVSSGYFKVITFIFGIIFKIAKDYATVSNVENVFLKLDICNYISGFLDFAQFVLMIIFGIMAFKGKEVKVPLATKLALKAYGIVVPKKEKEKNPITNDEETLTDIPKAKEEK